jgi:hypothetical protein
MNSNLSSCASRHLLLFASSSFCQKTFRSCDRPRQSCRNFLKKFKKMRRHEGIVPLVAPEQGSSLP